MYSSAQGLVTGAKWPSQSLFMQSRRRNANDWLTITRRGSEWNADVMTQTGAECAEPVADRRGAVLSLKSSTVVFPFRQQAYPVTVR